MEDLRVRLFKFAALCCVATLLLAEGSVLQSGDQIVQCAETKVKVQGHCGASNASVCQAVENFTLTLTCSPCGDQDTVQWTFSNSSEEEFKLLPEQNKTLVIAAVNVTNEKASGCYMCECGRSGLNFTVQVDLPVPPTFLVRTEEDGGPTHFDLHPETRRVPLEETSAGMVCINCSAVGYPDLHYWWYYDDGSGHHYNASSDPCLSFYEDQPEVLCFTPTIHNVEQQRKYYCQVSNIVQTVTAEQYITYPGSAEMSEWFMRPHQLQSRGEIPLNDGRATAICAAYPQIDLYVQVEYYVCAVPKLAEAGESACLFDSLQCCSCHDNSCHLKLGINVATVKFYDSLGIPTDGCRVESATEGNFVCVLEKTISTDGTTSAKQFIGNFSFVLLPWIHTTSLTPWGNRAVSAAVSATVIGLIIIAVGIPLCVRHYRRRKRDTVKMTREANDDHEEEENGGTSETNPLLHVAANSASQPVVRHTVDRSFQSVKVITNLEGKEDIVAKWKLRSDGQLELPGSMPGATYFLAVYTSDENRVKIPTAVATDSDIDERLCCINQALVKGVDINLTVLTDMYAQRVVNRHQNGQIHAMHKRHEPRDVIAAYFANSVVNNWPDAIFAQQMKNLVSVLRASDDDTANLSVADQLDETMPPETSVGVTD